MLEEFDDFDIFEVTDRIEIYAHLIWSTAGQEPLLAAAWGFCPGRLPACSDGALLCADGGPEHLHLLVNMPPTISLDDLVRLLKTSSVHWIRANVPGCEGFAWQEEYFAESVSPWNLDEMRAYIHHQHAYHQERTFQEEILAFLRASYIPYDSEDDLWH